MGLVYTVTQSSFITAILLVAFILFLAARNRLSIYTAVLWGNPSSSSGTATVSPASPASQAATTMINTATSNVASGINLGNVVSTIGNFLGSAATFGLGE